MKATALILVIALAPGAALAQVPTGQQEAVCSAEAVDKQQHEVQLSADLSERVEVPQRLLRIFELMKQPGVHPELLELVEVSESKASFTFASAPKAALSGAQWTAIVAVIAVAAVVVIIALTCSSCWNNIQSAPR